VCNARWFPSSLSIIARTPNGIVIFAVATNLDSRDIGRAELKAEMINGFTPAMTVVKLNPDPYRSGKPHVRFDEGGQARACSLLYPLNRYPVVVSPVVVSHPRRKPISCIN